MSTHRSDWPSTPDSHPEFGRLCPSPSRRRSMRLAIVCVLAGMAIGATMGLAFAHWRDNDVVPSPAAGSIDEEPLAEGVAVPAVRDISVVSARPSTSADELTAARPQGFCKDTGGKDLATAFLNPTCDSAKPHARHPARTTYRVATVTVGRTESPSAAEPMPVTAAAIEPSHAAVGAAGRPLIPTTQPIERPAPPKKPKTAPSAPIALTPPAREPSQQDAGINAYAAMPWPGRDYFQRPGGTTRAAVLQPSLGGPFGGIR
jgi:hypothetical protein